MKMSDIKTRLFTVRERINSAAIQYNRAPDSVQLLAVSKTWPAECVLEAAQCGQRLFGENYLQEALEKIEQTRSFEPELEWHYIGTIQSNKTRDIAEHFAWAHSVDRLKIAQRLSDQRPAHLPPLNICLQVNISEESSKSGSSFADALELANAMNELPGVTLRGLMAIPAPTSDHQQQRAIFHRIALLQQHIIESGIDLDTLSMGMSDDMEAAIAEGSTIVRIGSAIFGARTYTR